MLNDPHNVSSERGGAFTSLSTHITVFESGDHVDTWDPIFPAFEDPDWVTNVCVSQPAVGLDANWTNPDKATSFGTSAATFQGFVSWSANWINSWNTIFSEDAPGLPSTAEENHSWTRYQTEVSGNGDFVLNLLADNCSWVFLDGTLVGVQGNTVTDATTTYPVNLTGTHDLDFIIFDGGGQAGGMFLLETNTDTEFADSDGDGLADISEENIHGTDPNDPDSDGDGISDGDEVAAGTDPNAAGPVDSDGDGYPDNQDAFPNDPDEWADSDGDGVGDNADPFPNSDQSATVTVDGTDTGITNQSLGDGSTFNDRIGVCKVDARNHGEYVRCVVKLTDSWKQAGLISGREAGQIRNAAARNNDRSRGGR